MLSGSGGGFLWGGQTGSCRSKPVGCAGDMGDLGSAMWELLGALGVVLLENLHGIQAGLCWRGLQSSSHPTLCHGTLDQRLHPHPNWHQGWTLPPLHLGLSPLLQSRVCPAAQPRGEGALGASLAPLPPAQHLLCLLSSHQPGLCCSSLPCVQCQASVAGKALGAEQIPPARWAPAMAEPPRLPLALPERPRPQQPPGHVSPVSLGQLCSPCTSGSAHPVLALCADVFMGWRGVCVLLQ